MEDAIYFRDPAVIPYEIHIDQRRFARAAAPETLACIENLLLQSPPFLLHLWDGSNDYFDHDEHWDAWGVQWIDGRPSLPRHLSAEEDPALPDNRSSDWRQKNKETMATGTESYVLGHVWFTLFERLHFLYGFDTILMLPHLDPDRFIVLRDQITQHALEKIEIYLQMEVDGIFFSDDWGSQQGLIINKTEWLKYYAPAYERLFLPIRKAGKAVWFHSCGNIVELIPEFIRLGVNVLNPVQSSVLNIQELSDRFGGRICFFGGLDTQRLLPQADPGSIKKEIYRLVGLLGRFKGGYIGGTSHTILPDVPLENIRAVFDIFSELHSR